MMELNRIYQGHCLDVISTFPDASIDCVITSPPYFQLRDYGWEGQWGLESSWQAYLHNLWSLMEEVYRVLKPTGSAWINLGDTYSTNGNNKQSFRRDKAKAVPSINKDTEFADKCLLLIPHRFAIGCIDRGWIVRNDCIWAKRNGMPESVTDRFSKKHEYFFFMVKQEKYYFDLDGIRDKIIYNSDARGRFSKHPNNSGNDEIFINPLGKNPGSVADFWDVPTKPSSKNHYASFNSQLIDKPIIAGCPAGGIILDPFAGTGTTLIRAYQLDRKVVGIEGKQQYVEEANKYLQPELNQTKLFA